MTNPVMMAPAALAAALVELVEGETVYLDRPEDRAALIRAARAIGVTVLWNERSVWRTSC